MDQASRGHPTLPWRALESSDLTLLGLSIHYSGAVPHSKLCVTHLFNVETLHVVVVLDPLGRLAAGGADQPAPLCTS